MSNRRVFGKYTAAAIVAPCNFLRAVQQPAPAEPQCSVMMWPLSKLGSFEDNLDRVSQAGYKRIELVGEFERWSDGETAHYLSRMRELSLTVDATAGLKASFCDPAGTEVFLSALQDFLPKVRRLGCRQVILASGMRVEGAAEGAQQRASIETLKRAVKLLDAAEVIAMIEPIDRLENPPIYLDSVIDGAEIVKAVDNPRVRLLYDFYHEQRTHGDLLEKLQKVIGQVGLIHIADSPDRHQPGTGEIDYANIYRKLGQLQYQGFLAMEFYPAGDVVQTLRRAREEAAQCYIEGARRV